MIDLTPPSCRSPSMAPFFSTCLAPVSESAQQSSCPFGKANIEPALHMWPSNELIEAMPGTFSDKHARGEPRHENMSEQYYRSPDGAHEEPRR